VNRKWKNWYQNEVDEEKKGLLIPETRLSMKCLASAIPKIGYCLSFLLHCTDIKLSVSTANYTMPAFSPQPQNITALWLILILPSHGG